MFASFGVGELEVRAMDGVSRSHKQETGENQVSRMIL